MTEDAQVQSENGTEMASEAPIVEHERTHLTPREHELLRELLRPGVSIEAVIPADADPQELWSTLDACAKGLGVIDARGARLKFIIGKILTVFESKPSMYKELGFNTFSDFLKFGAYDKLGLHRTAAIEAKQAAQEWPQLTPDAYVDVKPKNLNTLHKIGINGKSPNAELWLEAAKKMKVHEFRQYAEQRTFSPVDDTIGATIIINTRKDIYDQWKKFVADGRICSKVGTKDHGEILCALMASCFVEWVDEVERARQAEQVPA